MDTIEETDFSRHVNQTTYAACKPQKNNWSDEDTETFYRGLRMFATDFNMISKMFGGGRTRLVATALPWCSTSRLSDETLAMAALLRVDTMSLTSILKEHPEERMKYLYLMGIVAGSSLLLTQDMFFTLGNIGFPSPDGLSHSFDNRGNGYGRGEGVAAIILKPVHAALRDGDGLRTNTAAGTVPPRPSSIPAGVSGTPP
ncbi:hypothetical protein DFH09DRAFT_1301970 [Mycena vulgaris]|nr:hypothetical protein DFH09DRAFT_1301970 [Mycena vulgaris]